MKSAELKVELDALVAQQATRYEEMDASIMALVDDLTGVATTFVNEEVRRAIENFPEKVQSMGVEKVAELKASVKVFVDSLSSAIARELSESSKWPHRCRPASAELAWKVPERYFIELIKGVTAGIGEILNEHGLIKSGEHSGWRRIGNTMQYAYNPGFDPRRFPPTMSYEAAYNELGTLSKKARDKQAEFEKAKAKEMWESA